MTENNDRFEQNLNQMFQSALEEPRPAYQERLVSAVLAETARERRRHHHQAGSSTSNLWNQLGLFLKPVHFALGTSAVLLLGVGLLWIARPSGGSVGQLSCLYGLVAVQHNGSSAPISEATDLRSGQRVQTQTGSKAQIVLSDKSRLTPDPRTSVQIQQTRHGPKILLERGMISLEASKQPDGKAITIEASPARVKVLGTKLDVRLIEKPSGARQTRVRVSSGKVEMESGGRTVLLPAGTEGIADENQPPVRASMVFEVNELIRLFRQTRTAAAQPVQQALPSIIDLAAGTIWSIVPIKQLEHLQGNTANLNLRYPAFPARAYTLDGGELATHGQGHTLKIDLSSAGTPAPDYLILKVPGVGGLLRSDNGCYEFDLETDNHVPPSWVQFHLPAWARIQASPEVSACEVARDKLVLTLTTQVRLPKIFE